MKLAMNVKRLAVVSVVAGLLLSGCGRSDGSQSGSTSANGEVTTIDDSPATGKITVWAMGEEGEKLPGFAKTFEEENPDANVEVTSIPWADVRTKIQASVSTGNVPDVVMIGSDQMPMVVSTGGLATVPEGVMDGADFFEGAMESAVTQDQTYGVPWYVETRVLYYRSDIAQQAGLKTPTTWKELKELAQGFKDNGAKYGIALPMGAAEDSTQAILPFLSQAGGQALSDDGESWNLDTKEMAEAIDFYASFFQEGLAPIAGYRDEQTTNFVNGSNPSFISGPWMINVLTELTDEQWVADNVATAVVPAGTANNDSYIGGANLGVFADAKNPEGAWKFVKWLGTPEVQQKWFDLTSDLPAHKGAWDYPALQENDRIAVLNEQLNNTVAPPNVPSWDEVSATIEGEAEKVANGVITGAEAAKVSQENAEALGMGW